MPSVPLFFGAPARSRFGLLNWPEGAARGGVVICPPLGYENVCARESLRLLAEELAARNIGCLRFDYDGTENSMGQDTDSDRVAAWLASISDAIDTMTTYGFERVTLVGLRVGALLASQLAARDDVAGLVEWDSIDSGRRFTRTLKLMAGTAGGSDAPVAATAGAEPNGIVYVGVRYPEAALADLSKLRRGAVPPRTPWLVIERDPSESPQAGASAPADATTLAVRVTLAGTRDMLENTAETAVVARDIVGHIADWVVRNVTAATPTPAPSDVIQTAYESVGRRRLEHTAERLGPARLLAVTTRVEGSQPQRALLMTNNGKASMIGPGAAWVDFARDLAADDLLAMRVDISGLGDSPVRPGRISSDDYSAAAADDFGDVCDHLQGLGVRSVIVVGLCSGALLAYDGALASALITDIVSINPRFDKPFHDRRRDRASRACGQTFWPLSVPLSKSPLYPYVDKIPGWVWRVSAALHLVAAPSVALRRVLARRPTRILLLFSRGERGYAALTKQTAKEFKAMLGDPRLDMIHLDSSDHSMFHLAMRGQVLDIVRERLATTDDPARQ